MHSSKAKPLDPGLCRYPVAFVMSQMTSIVKNPKSLTRSKRCFFIKNTTFSYVKKRALALSLRPTPCYLTRPIIQAPEHPTSIVLEGTSFFKLNTRKLRSHHPELANKLIGRL
jgi:hypothetical protein